ncbi:MAG: glycosyltransferase family 4 protein [Ilumatobacteraceae bacterium]|nr:glycosyltransferase family 4 protein [Ilumatobacteraceae bacterium]
MTDRLKLLVLCPHFDPDTAPTGAVMSRIVEELGALGHEVHVVTSLPWYREHRVDEAWSTVRWRDRTATTGWGTIARLDPHAGGDKRNLVRRAVGFIGFSVVSIVAGVLAGRRGRRVDAVIAMSPPLTLGVAGRLVAWIRRAPLIFNIQDVFPDAAVETGAITNRWVIGAARALEKVSYLLSSRVTVLSQDLADNVVSKIGASKATRVVVIPNFVDTERIVPLDAATDYRRELGLTDRPVVMYAGNIGYSQSLEMLVAAARARPDVDFVINGTGSARSDLERSARGLTNLIFGDFQPPERLSEVLATGDIHVVPLRRGLGRVSVPSKTYSIMAAGRPIVAAVDAGTEVTRLVDGARSGLVVPPDETESFIAAIDRLVSDRDVRRDMGQRARAFVESQASPRAVAERYANLVHEIRRSKR